jgi:hypothetical protein
MCWDTDEVKPLNFIRVNKVNRKCAMEGFPILGYPGVIWLTLIVLFDNAIIWLMWAYIYKYEGTILIIEVLGENNGGLY